MNTALVLLSGGMDSVSCLHWAIGRYGEVQALGFDWGQPNRNAELTAAQRISERRSVPFRIELLPELGGGLKDGVSDHTEEPGISPAFVPGRNGTFLWRALNAAATTWPGFAPLTLVFGACAEDRDAFPDCRREFFDTLQESMSLGLGRTVVVATPFVHQSKQEIVSAMAHRGCALSDVLESWSCYRGTACGTCTACVLRGRAIAAHGLPDLATPPVMRGGDADRAWRLGG